MKKLNKKGFTIVELVIVIAVIAILAAVLIPTFAGVVGDATETANKQEAANIYKQYAFDMAKEGDLAEKVNVQLDAVTVVYVENGAAVSIGANAEAEGYLVKTTTKVEALDDEDDAVIVEWTVEDSASVWNVTATPHTCTDTTPEDDVCDSGVNCPLAK